MKKYRKLLIAFSVLLAVGLIILVFYSSNNIKENFKTPDVTTTPSKTTKSAKTATPSKTAKAESSTTPAKSLTLSDKETSLFNDLLSNKLTDGSIQSLIEKGFLTENMIERFLSKLQEGFTGSVTSNLIDNPNTPNPLKLHNLVPKNKAIVEGFTTLMPLYATHA